MWHGSLKPTRLLRRAAGSVILLVMLGAGLQEALGETAPAASSAHRQVTYVPPDRNAPETRVAAATRAQASDEPYLALLAPRQTGHTSEASPTLYWYLSAAVARPVRVALIDPRQVDPALELDLERGLEAGVQALPLAAHKVTLEPGVEYEWSVTLVLDPNQPSGDIFAGGTIRRVASAGLPAAADGTDRLAALAEQGLWYDAIDLASRRIAADPKDGVWRALRASLLEQQGLAEPAREDRRLAGLQ
jgi:hypothetical protein